MNITHVLKVFVNDRSELNKVLAKERKKEVSLLKHAKSLAGHYGYQGTYVSCKAAEKFAAREFEKHHKKQQSLQLLLHVNPDDQYDFLPLMNIVSLNKEIEALQPSISTQNAEMMCSIAIEQLTTEDDHRQALSEGPRIPIEVWDRAADDIASQPVVVRGLDHDDVIAVQPHNTHHPCLEIATTEYSSSSSRPVSLTPYKSYTSVCLTTLLKRYLPANVEGTGLQKRQKTPVQPVSGQTLPRSVGPLRGSSNGIPSPNITNYHIFATSQHGKGINQELQTLRAQATSSSMTSRNLECFDVVARIRAAEHEKARIELLASNAVAMSTQRQSLETRLKSAQSALSDKRLALAGLSRETEELTREMVDLRRRLEELENKYEDLNRKSNNLDCEIERQDRELEEQKTFLEASNAEMMQKQNEYHELVLRRAEHRRVLKPYQDQLNGFFSEDAQDLAVS